MTFRWRRRSDLADYPRLTTIRSSHSIDTGTMRNIVYTIIAAGTLLLPAAAQTYRAPRAADGHADLSGVYQALNTANWDLEDHSAQAATMWQTGTIGAVPAGESVVEGGAIPYKPAA